MEKKPEHRPYNAAKVAEALSEIEQKVIELKSAGVDRASKRKVDHTDQDTKLDEEEKNIARELLGKKKKKKKVAIHRQGWFTALAALIFLGCVGGLFAWIFLTPPSAEGLISQARGWMDSKTLFDRKQAREPIDLFFQHYPAHKNAAIMQEWRDQIERESVEYYLERPIDRKFGEKDGWRAFDDEEAGNLENASKYWLKILPLKKDADPEKRGWGLVAERHGREIFFANQFWEDTQEKLKANRKPT